MHVTIEQPAQIFASCDRDGCHLLPNATGYRCRTIHRQGNQNLAGKLTVTQCNYACPNRRLSSQYLQHFLAKGYMLQ